MYLKVFHIRSIERTLLFLVINCKSVLSISAFQVWLKEINFRCFESYRNVPVKLQVSCEESSTLHPRKYWTLYPDNKFNLKKSGNSNNFDSKQKSAKDWWYGLILIFFWMFSLPSSSFVYIKFRLFSSIVEN